jgi:hypothetical protein
MNDVSKNPLRRSTADLAALRDAYEDPTFAFRNAFMQAALGRKP